MMIDQHLLEKNFYGGDPRLLDSNNVPLTLDETDDLYTDLGLSLILTRF
jgi:hypothetical protein